MKTFICSESPRRYICTAGHLIADVRQSLIRKTLHSLELIPIFAYRGWLAVRTKQNFGGKFQDPVEILPQVQRTPRVSLLETFYLFYIWFLLFSVLLLYQQGRFLEKKGATRGLQNWPKTTELIPTGEHPGNIWKYI